MARKTTVAEAIVQVARNMSLVTGHGVQPYSEDQIIGMLEGAHQFIVDEGPEWPDLMTPYTRTLDGTTGLITEKITDVYGALTSARVKRVYHSASNRPLPIISNYSNLLVNTFPYGYRLLGMREETATQGKYLIQFYPNTTEGQVVIQVMEDFDLSDPKEVIPIDWWLHVYHASWQYATDDGTNMGQVEKYKNLYNIRMKQCIARLSTHSYSMDPMNTVPTQWMEYDTP